MGHAEHPTFVQLRALVDVFEKEGFTAAAGSRRDVPRTVNQLQRLSDTLRVKLTAPQPGPRPPVFTPAGRELALAAKRILAAYDQFLAVADDYRDSDMPVVWVGAYPAHVRFFGAAAARALSERMRVRFYGTSDTLRATSGNSLYTMLSHGFVDVAVCTGEPTQQGKFASQLLYSWRMVVMQFDGREEQGALSIRELADQPLLCSPRNHLSRETLISEASRAGVQLRVVAESESVEALLAMAEQGLGWLVVPDDSLSPEVRSRARPVLDADNKVIGGTYSAWYRRLRVREEVLALTAEFVRCSQALRRPLVA